MTPRPNPLPKWVTFPSTVEKLKQGVTLKLETRKEKDISRGARVHVILTLTITTDSLGLHKNKLLPDP